MVAQFVASLQGSSCVKFDGDAAGKVTFTVPASAVGELAKVLLCLEEELIITVERANATSRKR